MSVALCLCARETCIVIVVHHWHLVLWFVAEIQRVFFVSPPKAILPLSMLSIKFKTSKT